MEITALTTATLAHRQQIAFISITSRDGFGMVRPVTLPVAEIIVYFLSTVWLVTLALMVREVVLLCFRVSSMVIVTDAPWSYIWLALRSDWSWLWS